MTISFIITLNLKKMKSEYISHQKPIRIKKIKPRTGLHKAQLKLIYY